MAKKTTKPTEESAQPAQPTSISDVKAAIQAKKNGLPVTLPSGLVFMLKKPSIARMMQDDQFPAELVSVAIQMDSKEQLNPTTREEYLQYLKVMDTVVMAACVAPKVTDDEAKVDDETIYIKDVDDMDRAFIFMHAQMGVDKHKPFREGKKNPSTGPGVPKVPGTETE